MTDSEHAVNAAYNLDVIKIVTQLRNLAMFRQMCMSLCCSSRLLSDQFINAGCDLSVHIAFLLTCIITHGSVAKDFLTSSIIPIPKKRGGNASVSDNFRGIALSSVFGKMLDIIVLDKFQKQLRTSDLQFGFKSCSSTHMYRGFERDIIVLRQE